MMTYKCPDCGNECQYSLIPVSPHPDSDFICYDCLPDEVKKAYDRFYGHNESHEPQIQRKDRNDAT